MVWGRIVAEIEGGSGFRRGRNKGWKKTGGTRRKFCGREWEKSRRKENEYGCYWRESWATIKIASVQHLFQPFYWAHISKVDQRKSLINWIRSSLVLIYIYRQNHKAYSFTILVSGLPLRSLPAAEQVDEVIQHHHPGFGVYNRRIINGC